MARRLLARRWTADEDADLSRMWIAGRPVARIALKMGRGKSSIYVRAAALGLPTRPSFRRSPPLAPGQIRVSLSRPSHLWMLGEMQRRSLSREWTEAERDEFRKMWLDGATLLRIASRLRRSKYAVERQRQVLGLPTRSEVLRRKENRDRV